MGHQELLTRIVGGRCSSREEVFVLIRVSDLGRARTVRGQCGTRIVVSVLYCELKIWRLVFAFSVASAQHRWQQSKRCNFSKKIGIAFFSWYCGQRTANALVDKIGDKLLSSVSVSSTSRSPLPTFLFRIYPSQHLNFKSIMNSNERTHTPPRVGDVDRADFPPPIDRNDPNQLGQQKFMRSVPLINLSGDRCDFTESVSYSSMSVFDLKLKLAFQKDIAPRRLKILCECVDENGVPSEREMTDAERLPAVVYPEIGPGGGTGIGATAQAQPALAQEHESDVPYRVIDAGPTRVLFEASHVELRDGLEGIEGGQDWFAEELLGNGKNRMPESVGRVRLIEIDLISKTNNGYFFPTDLFSGFSTKWIDKREGHTTSTLLRKATKSFTKLFGLSIEWTAVCTCEEMKSDDPDRAPCVGKSGVCWRCEKSSRDFRRSPDRVWNKERGDWELDAVKKATEVTTDFMRFSGISDTGFDINRRRPFPIVRKGREVSIYCADAHVANVPTHHHFVFVSDEQAQRFSSVLLEYAQFFSRGRDEGAAFLPEGPGPVRGDET